MADWLRIEFYAQVPDGMEMSIDGEETCATIARTFGFSRARDLNVEQVSDGAQLRHLVNGRPSEGPTIWPSN